VSRASVASSKKANDNSRVELARLLADADDPVRARFEAKWRPECKVYSECWDDRVWKQNLRNWCDVVEESVNTLIIELTQPLFDADQAVVDQWADLVRTMGARTIFNEVEKWITCGIFVDALVASQSRIITALPVLTI